MSHAFNNETCTMLVNSENSASVVAQHTDRPSREAAQVPTALLLKQLPASGPRPWAPAPHGILRSSSWCLPPWPAQVQEPQQCRKWVSSKQNLKKKKNPSKGFPLGCWELFKGVTPESCISFLMHSQARDGGDPMTESRLSLWRRFLSVHFQERQINSSGQSKCHYDITKTSDLRT